MKSYTCVIIDDELDAIKWLSDYVNQLPNLMLLKTYSNPLEALSEFSSGGEVDLVLIDIEMPILNGIDLSNQIRKKAKRLVFTTAYKKYAYQAFEAEADGYLLKPYTLSKFSVMVGRLFQEKNEMQSGTLEEAFFFAKNKSDNFKLVKIRYVDIVAVESKQNYVLIHTVAKNILTHMTLTEIGKVLNLFNCFIQFQRSFIVNKNHIEYIYGNTLKMINGLEISVGDYYRKEFAAFLSVKVLKSGT